jgi:hypothetical protein
MRISSWLAILYTVVTIAGASPPVIGVARSRAAMIVNHATVPGVATILEGTSVETTDTASSLNLASGERVMLAPRSSARIHQDRIVLDKGGAGLSGSSSYRIETSGFQVRLSSPASHVQVAIQGAGRIHVEAAGGTGEVHNAEGVLVAKVLAGKALELQNTGSSSTRLTGTVYSRDGRYFLTDEISNVHVELSGSNLGVLVGRRTEIVGARLASAAPLAGTSQVIAVSSAVLAFDGAGGGVPSADSGMPDPTPGQNAPPQTMPPQATTPQATPHSKKKAALIIVGGVVVTGGTLGGLWAAGVIGGSSSVSQ